MKGKIMLKLLWILGHVFVAMFIVVFYVRFMLFLIQEKRRKK